MAAYGNADFISPRIQTPCVEKALEHFEGFFFFDAVNGFPWQQYSTNVLAVTHTITSAAIGSQIQSVPLAFSTAYVFHYFADTLLHWNIYTDRHRMPYIWIVLDVLGGLLIAYWLMPDRFFTAPVLAAILGGNLPDIYGGGLEALQRLFPRYAPFLDRLYDPFHEKLQNETLNPWKGLVWQAILLVVSLALI